MTIAAEHSADASGEDSAEASGRAAFDRRWPRRFARALRAEPGPEVGDLFARLLAIVFLVAWLSLGAQVRLLIGARGLTPLRDFVEAARDQSGLSFWDFPTLFWWIQSDGALLAGVVVGIALALAALAGRRRRIALAASTALYLSYAVACRTFLSFQWDNLLLECGLLASFLPPRRAAPVIHLLLRFVLFKLYFESGIAKWRSPLHDWQDGSAMTLYYETAPLPTWLAWYAHHLPVAWHHFESRATLVMELIVPFGIFGPRRARLGAAALLTLFQIANIATANYGFFCYLTLALHVLLLDDADVHRAWRRIRRGGGPAARAPDAAPGPAPAAASRARAPAWRRSAGAAGALAFVGVSVIQALFHFTEPGPALARLAPILQLSQTWRLINTYHLFAAITRDRIEPEFQTSVDGGATWTAQHLRHKPGDVARAPDLVAPHQPRVDFQLWFYGLGFQRREPSYVATLIGRLCEDPAAIARLFRAPPPPHADAVRVAYWRYRFTTARERRETGAWWWRESVGATRAIPCDR
jgi:hypothetical protein